MKNATFLQKTVPSLFLIANISIAAQDLWEIYSGFHGNNQADGQAIGKEASIEAQQFSPRKILFYKRKNTAEADLHKKLSETTIGGPFQIQI